MTALFPRIIHDEKCPLDGYESLTFRVLVNPTAAEKTDWALGHMGLTDCPACAKLNTPRGKAKGDDSAKKYCDACTESRDRLGRAAVAVYGTSQVNGFDFTTPDAALATFSMPDLPDELLGWLYQLPNARWLARADDLAKKLISPSTNAS